MAEGSTGKDALKERSEEKARKPRANAKTEEQNVVLTSGRDAKPHFSLTVAHAAETVEVQDVGGEVGERSGVAIAHLVGVTFLFGALARLGLRRAE